MRFVSSGHLIRVLFVFIYINKANARVTGILVSNSLRGRELSTQTIATPKCNTIRTSPYPAELQLFYSYSVEFKIAFSLADIERAIANAVALELDMCDILSRPVYKVKTITGHSFSNSGRF
ncbi:MAG: hypothetical protein ACI8RD_001775 [Bacillariaceae sp.]|jgi:hypothetical protein